MNEQQPYEKHLAEKLQQLPLPDVEPNWQQMKTLLDKRMPRGGAYWRWITGVGIILIMLFGGTWFFTNRNEPVTASNRPERNNAGEGVQITPLDSPAHLSPPQKNALRQKQNNPDPQTNTSKKDFPINDISNKPIADEETLPKRLSRSENKTSGKSDIQKSKVTEGSPVVDPTNFPMHRSAKNTNEADRILAGSDGYNDPSPTRSIKNPSDQKLKELSQDLDIKRSSSNFKINNLVGRAEVSAIVGDSIERPYYADLFPERKDANQQKQGKNKLQKSKDILAGENKSLAIGFSLPLGFPLGDQKPGAYNINARPNVISDFLPVPHLQYHINNKLYLQTELQLMNPQYIQPVLLYQRKNEVLTTNTVYSNSVYAKKLYYFNVPVGIHYSPFQHFYLGTGLQFSSFLSGVALHEQTRSTIGSNRYDLMGQQYTKFKNDTISQKIDNNEFRLMLDANYYWRQFTVGLRYNQALSNYVSFRLNNTAPLFQDKNKSLQFYLRYNLWENHKKFSSLTKVNK